MLTRDDIRSLAPDCMARVHREVRRRVEADVHNRSYNFHLAQLCAEIDAGATTQPAEPVTIEGIRAKVLSFVEHARRSGRNLSDREDSALKNLEDFAKNGAARASATHHLRRSHTFGFVGSPIEGVGDTPGAAEADYYRKVRALRAKTHGDFEPPEAA